MLANLTDEDVKIYKARFSPWLDCSHAVCARLPRRLRQLQGLGAIDAELFLEEHSARTKPHDDLATNMVQTNRLLTLSELWVYGVYEFVRTLHDAARDDQGIFGLEGNEIILGMKRSLERIRVPMAKGRPAQRAAQDGDSGEAIPAVWSDKRVGWSLGQNAHIARTDLAEELANALQRLGQIAETMRSASPHFATEKGSPSNQEG